MKKIFNAATVEEARELAAKEFEVSEELISFTVIEEPKKGLFGKIKGEAKVEAEYTAPSKADAAVSYIKKVLAAMGIENVTAQVEEIEGGAALEVNGDGFEELINGKPELVDSLQYLSSLACNKLGGDYYRINIDCNGFRERRKAELEELAKKIANGVKKTGRSSALEPMNPYERRIVHSVVAEIDGVVSKSKGEEPYRKVIISSTAPRKYNDRGGYKKRGGRRRQSPKKEFDISTSFEKDYKKPKPEDDLNLGSGLYGKIEF